MDRLRKEGTKLVYRCGKQRSDHQRQAGAKVDELHLTPLELIDRIAALVPRRTGTAILACGTQLAAQGCGDGAGDTGASRSRADASISRGVAPGVVP
jgi:hypothetical protein